MATCRVGLECEDMLREVLKGTGIPHTWANDFEDDVLGVDCWWGQRRDPVDFTVILPGSELAAEKLAKAMNRGVIPVFLERYLILRAYCDGSHGALEELLQEIRVQVPIRSKLLRVRMTPERAEQAKKAPKQRQPVAVG